MKFQSWRVLDFILVCALLSLSGPSSKANAAGLPLPTPVAARPLVRPVRPLRPVVPAPRAASVATANASKDEVVDLNQMSATPAANPLQTGANAPGPGTPTNAGYGAGQKIDLSSVFFHFYFDFWLINRPGFGPLTFQNIHSISMVEAQPREDLFFSAEVSTSPRYYEVKYAPVGKKWNVRFGKIWIPFDDVNPHNHFGGRTNTRQLLSGNTLFLPNIWTELGVAFESKLFDYRGWRSVGAVYVTNGFGAGGKNPSGDPGEYPSFSDADVLATDNNGDKALGARLQFNFKQSFELGFSAYTGRWSSQALPSKRLSLMGVDASYQFGRFELRGGFLAGKVDLLDGSMKKGGAYAEFWTKLLPARTLRVALKAGILQYDDRYITANDLKAVGAGIYYRPNFIQYSIEHSQDLEKVGTKKGYGITWLRLAILI